MNVLDENIPEDKRQLLRSWGIRIRQIGRDLGDEGLQDEEIVRLLHQLRGSTFFTRDAHFYDRGLCHESYCLVWLDVAQFEVASFVRRVLRHPAFTSRTKRMGTVVRLDHARLYMWSLRASEQQTLGWPNQPR